MRLQEELKVAEHLAREAGALVVKMRATSPATYKENGEGPVTEADKSADVLIRTGLSAAFPRDSIITEESYTSSTRIPKSGRCWFVDPIDGTTDYVNRGDDFSVMIGLAIDGVASVGVVFQPSSGVLWRGIFARNSETLAERVDKDGEVTRLEVSKKPVAAAGPIAAVSRNHPSRFVDFLVQELHVSAVIPKGSVGLKLAIIADEVADFYVSGSKRIKLWDTCAPHAILVAAGGLVEALDRTALVYNHGIAHGKEILCATPACSALIRPKLDDVLSRYRR
ncbi:3'(2'),5'-bisphosphate nucleotidase CysQ [bacterium]|nr:MAG: 3'(2'),5'-bisphosphate nucleotidase CysQ [bacterium]